MSTMLPFFQVDAFTSKVFGGNPAGVCPLESWLDDATMQRIAAENNVSETAFFVGGDGRYDLRWFTPEVEVSLCGHATLAAAFIVLNELEPKRSTVDFDTKSGRLSVRQADGLLHMDFPSLPARAIETPPLLVEAIGVEPVEVYLEERMMAVLRSEAEVAAVKPAIDKVAQLDARALIITAPGVDVDFVSRFFAPRAGVAEDPVTGSAHCVLLPYWSERLGKRKLNARQISRRGGDLTCEYLGKQVRIAGEAVVYLRGAIIV